jgi:hypothetical protein
LNMKSVDNNNTTETETEQNFKQQGYMFMQIKVGYIRFGVFAFSVKCRNQNINQLTDWTSTNKTRQKKLNT